jgi:hypothetical protein
MLAGYMGEKEQREGVGDREQKQREERKALSQAQAPQSSF